MSLADKIKPYTHADLAGFVPVNINGKQYGWASDEIAQKLGCYPHIWIYDTASGLHLHESLETFKQRTDAVDSCFVQLSSQGLLPVMPDYSQFGEIDWFPVGGTQNPYFIVKRFYAPYLGIRVDSVVLNGYQDQHYWTSTRSEHVHDSPGKLDIMSAGAVTYGNSIFEGLVDEAYHEAGLSEADLAHAQNEGTIHVHYIDKKNRFINEYFHVFDLNTKGNIIPKTRIPFEVAGYNLMSFDKVMDIIHNTTEYSPKIILVVIDFMLRHGYLDQHDPMHESVCVLLSRCRNPEKS